MQSIVYDKNNGTILLIKTCDGIDKITIPMAERMFPSRKIGIWKIENKMLNVKSNRISLNPDGTPRGIVLFEEKKEEIQIEDFKKKNPNAKKIIYKGVFYDHGGYANMNREFALRLAKIGDIDLKIEVVNSGKQIDNFTFQQLDYLSKKSIPQNEAINIIGFTPMHTNTANFNIFFTMMEPETLHPNFAGACNKYADVIFTPTRWNKDVFIKGGIEKPIYVIPLGINHDIYKPNINKLNISCIELPSNKRTDKFKSFNFITLFGWSYRKGIDVLLKSYFNTFTNKDDVGLIICARHMGSSDSHHKSIVMKDINEFMKNYKNPPTVYYYGDNTEISKMPNLLRNGDCFVWASRGEGFGLPVIESGALEMPIISTFNSAMTDYLNEDNSFLVYTDQFVVADRNLTCISPHYVGQMFPKLGDKSIGQFGEKMKEVYTNYPKAMIKAKIFASEIREKYTWDICTKHFYDTLKGLSRK